MKKIVFVTGTRADFGKLKSLINMLNRYEAFETHLLSPVCTFDERYGYTVNEIEQHGMPMFPLPQPYRRDGHGYDAGKTTEWAFAQYTRVVKPDCIVVHGDRIEALVCATVGR